MTPPFPSREELKSRGYSPETLERYDQWRAAHAEAQQLAARLPLVFGSPPRPRITRHVAAGYDDEWHLSDARIVELQQLDPEQHWSEVSAKATQSAQGYFIYADAEGWAFYLPAFIHHYLAEFPFGGDDAVYWACVQKTHFDRLTPEQTAFIDEFTALCHRWQGEGMYW